MSPRVIALSGGVGGAKLVLGLAKVVPGSDLLVVANTADDFEHCGLHICPDIDTLLYTLAGLANPDQGWGLAGETWNFMEALRREDPEQAWFLLGDKDLETHRFRTQLLEGGATLTEVTAALARRFGVETVIAPMSDQPVRTFLKVTRSGSESWLPFQEYFVKYRCEPPICGIEYRSNNSGGAESAQPQRLLREADTSKLEAIVLGPSNPFLSIDPILSIPGMIERLRALGVPVIAVSPIISGRALKGPAAKIMRELGMAVDVVSVARHYRGLIDGMVVDEADRHARPEIEAMGMAVSVTKTVMVSLEDRVRLARECLEFAVELS